MKKVICLCILLASMAIASFDDNVSLRWGMTFGMDVANNSNTIVLGFKFEPGIDIGEFRIGLDMELNTLYDFVRNEHPTPVFYDDDDSFEAFAVNSKIGIAAYLNGKTISLIAEPYIVLPIGYDDELARYADKSFSVSKQLGYGIRGGIKFFTYNQLTVGYEKNCFNYYKSTSKISIAYSLLWQKEENTSYKSTYTSSYSSTYTPSYYSTYSDTTTHYSSYNDTTSYYGSNRVYVKGHLRHNKNGTISWVRPHTRSYPGTKTYGGRRRR